MTVRTKGLSNLNTFKAVAMAAIALLLFSCQNEQITDDRRITLYPVIDNKIETAVMTRADAVDKTKYTEYTGDARQALTVKAIAYEPNSSTRAQEKDADGVFAPLSPTGWRSGVKVEQNYDYNLYVYSSAMPTATPPTFSLTNGATLTFNGLDLITALDPLVCVAASGAVLEDDPDPNDYPELTEGSFSIGTITTVEVEGGGEKKTKAFLAMDHLYSKATLSFRVDNQYSQLRKVRIKEVEIKIAKSTLSGSHTYGFPSKKLTLDANKTYTGNPSSINLYDGPTATAQPEGENDYIELTTTFKEFGYFYFLPINPIPSMYLQVTYDVCDLNDNVVRADQTASNYSIFSSIDYNGGRAAAGTNYLVKILVSPSYLYQLSDDDLELGLTVEQQ